MDALHVAALANLALCVVYLPGVMLVMATDDPNRQALGQQIATVGVTAPAFPVVATVATLAVGSPACLLISLVPPVALFAVMAQNR